MTKINLQYEVKPEHEAYLETSARLRGMSRSALVYKLMTLILQDQMVLSILDDGGELNPRPAPGPSAGRPMPPQTNLYTAVRKRYNPTKSEMQEDLRQAVLNTAPSGERKQRGKNLGPIMSHEQRKRALLQRAAEGRFCPSDLGDVAEVNRWQAAMRALVFERRLVKCPPEPTSRRVYYELPPAIRDAVPSPESSSAASTLPSPGSSVGDHEPEPPEDVRGTMMHGGFA